MVHAKNEKQKVEHNQLIAIQIAAGDLSITPIVRVIQ